MASDSTDFTAAPRRFRAFCLTLLVAVIAILVSWTPASHAQQGLDDSEMVTISATGADAMPAVTVVSLKAKEDTDLNRRLADAIADELRALDIIVAEQADLTLIYDGSPIGSFEPPDTTIGSVRGNAEGDTEIEMRVWSSGDESSLLQGRRSARLERRGVRLELAIDHNLSRLWIGTASMSNNEGDVFVTLTGLLPLLTDRIGETVNEQVPY